MRVALGKSFGLPLPGGLPGFVPGAPAGVVPGPTMPANLFPTNVRPGDVVNVTGAFAGLHQGQVRVKFQGASWEAPALLGPYSAAVVVPDSAETGACMIEVNGQIVFGTQCVVGKAAEGRPNEMRKARPWKNFGEGTPMGNYIRSGLGASVLQSIGKQISRGGVPLRRRLTPFNVSPNWRPRPADPVRVVPMSPSAHCTLLGGTYINGVCAMPALPTRPLGDVVSGGSNAPPVLIDSGAAARKALELLRSKGPQMTVLKKRIFMVPIGPKSGAMAPIQPTRPTNTVVAPKDAVDLNPQPSPPPVDQEAAIRAECARKGGAYEGNVCYMPRDSSGGASAGAGGGGSYGGSSAGGGGGSAPAASIPTDEEILDAATPVAPASAGISQQHLLMAGAALGLFLLLRRK